MILRRKKLVRKAIRREKRKSKCDSVSKLRRNVMILFFMFLSYFINDSSYDYQSSLKGLISYAEFSLYFLLIILYFIN